MSCSRDLNAVSSSAAVLQKLSSWLEALKRKFATSAMSPPDKTALKHPALVQEEALSALAFFKAVPKASLRKNASRIWGSTQMSGPEQAVFGNGHATVLDGKLGDPSLHSRPDVLVVQRRQ